MVSIHKIPVSVQLIISVLTLGDALMKSQHPLISKRVVRYERKGKMRQRS